MKLAISNIAWENYKDSEILKLLHEYKVSGIELAPTKVWPEWKNITKESIQNLKNFIDNEGLEIPAMQAILFGKPELELFNTQTHQKFFDHFKLLSELAYELETNVLVFGAPKNRRRNQISVCEADEIAIDFFAKVGDILGESNTNLVIENNPVEYMCDYLTNVRDIENIVSKINSKNVKVHLDSAGIHMCGGEIEDIITSSKNFAHYHISEPMLNPIHEQKVEHFKALNALKQMKYTGWVSIEMKQTENEYDDIRKSLKFLNSIGV